MKEFLIVAVMWVLIFFGESNHKKQMQEIQELKALIEQRTYLDSLYWDHLNQCSFIHKDSIGVRRDGTLYDKHQRKYLP